MCNCLTNNSRINHFISFAIFPKFADAREENWHRDQNFHHTLQSRCHDFVPHCCLSLKKKKKKREEKKKKEKNERLFELGNNQRFSRREHSARSHCNPMVVQRERRHRRQRRREWNDNGAGWGAIKQPRVHFSRDEPRPFARSAQRRKVKSRRSDPGGGPGRKRRNGKGKKERNVRATHTHTGGELPSCRNYCWLTR